MIDATEKLKDLIIEVFDMRPSTAEKCIAILDDIKAIIENEERREQKMNNLIGCKDCKAIDAIKSEIEHMDFDFGDFYDHTDSIVEKVLQVIDKYKADSD